MSILISKKGANAQIVDKAAFKDEAMLQEYIHKNPEAIPVYELEEDKKLFVVKREFQTNSGPIDALAVDKDGDIYVVETKLYKNPDKRKVVAQALDYGAALWKHFVDFSAFIEILNEETRKSFDLEFYEKVIDFFSIDEDQADSMMDSLRSNLNEGIIKFVILMDSIDDRLKDLIIYINQNSQFDIYAVQLEYYEFEDNEIIIPKIFGVEVKKKVKKYEKSRQWDRVSWFAKLEATHGVDKVNTVKRFEKLVAGKPLYFHYSSQRKDETATLWVRSDPNNNSSKIFGFRLDNNVELSFVGLKKSPPFNEESLRNEFIKRLNQISDIAINAESVDSKATFPLSKIVDEKTLAQFCDVIGWCIQEISKFKDK